MTAMLLINDLVESLAEPPDLGGICRVLWVDRINDRAVLMVMEEAPKQPFPMQLSLLEGWIRAGVAHKTHRKPPAYMLRTELPDAAKARLGRCRPYPDRRHARRGRAALLRGLPPGVGGHLAADTCRRHLPQMRLR